MVRFFYFVILLILVGAVAIFAYQNFETVNVQWLKWGMTAPVAAVAGASYLLGMLSGWSVVGLFGARGTE